eukprot:GILK01011179.1.p1 GENE.GILK01011179.1~~GILK01011179.1.p1  ORF type:complete len:582 (-),score=117.52 GILK01011179.1:201-1946(-)
MLFSVWRSVPRFVRVSPGRFFHSSPRLRSEYACSIHDVSKVTPTGRKILDNVTLSFYHGAKIGVLGANGSGKSTLLRVISGEEKDVTGEIVPHKHLRIGFLHQEPILDPKKDVRGNVEDGLSHLRDMLIRFEELSAKLGDPDLTPEELDKVMEQQGKLQDEIDRHDAWELDRMVAVAMEALRVPVHVKDVSLLSGGEKRRVALCRLLLSRPDMLLLDEPTNHLDAFSVQWLEKFLAEYKGTVIAVTHDRYFLDNVAGWILEIDRGQCFPFKGNYTAWLQAKEKRLEMEKNRDVAMQRHMARELEWVRQTPRARQAKNKARLQAYEELLKKDTQEQISAGTIFVPPGRRLGRSVIKAENVSKSFNGRVLFKDLSFDIPPAATVGIIGPNGAGKTTLFRMITGQETADSGSFTIGSTVDVAYVDQSRAELNSANNVWEEISGGRDLLPFGNRSVASRNYCAWFNFKGESQQKHISMLSGGERNRVHMAKLLLSGGNLLLLDEPTNDLDVDTLRSLEEALTNFAGTSVVISHDRWFLNRVATHILAFEGNGHVEWFPGNFEEYERDRIRRGSDPKQKMKFKKIN